MKIGDIPDNKTFASRTSWDNMKKASLDIWLSL